MAKVSAHGAELYRYLNVRRHGLISVRSDGVQLIRYPGSNWKVLGRKKKEVTNGTVLAIKKRIFESLPAWARECKSLPSLEELNDWSMDGPCATVDDKECWEPDHRGIGGSAPSWLVALGYI